MNCPKLKDPLKNIGTLGETRVGANLCVRPVWGQTQGSAPTNKIPNGTGPSGASHQICLLAYLSRNTGDVFQRVLKEDEVRIFICQNPTPPKKTLYDVLSHYTKNPIQIGKGKHGKPFLESLGGHRGPPLRFNLSHTKALLVIAVSKNLEVGVDVEKIRELKDRDKLIARYFSPNEQKVFENLPENEKTKSFFFAWTQKEAYLKFLGKGITTDLRKIEVEMDPNEKPGFLTKPSEPLGKYRGAFFYPFELGEKHLGCVVTEKKIKGIQVCHEKKA